MNDLNVQQNQGDNPEHDVSHVIMMPNIEEDIPLPKNPKDAMPELGMEEELQVRVETVKTIADLKGEPIPDASPAEQQKAVDFVKKVMTDPNFKPEYGTYTDPTMAFCAGMVAQTQVLLAKQLADYKLYVVNNLIKVIESTKTPTEKTTALRALGEVDGVDAFDLRPFWLREHLNPAELFYFGRVLFLNLLELIAVCLLYRVEM